MSLVNIVRALGGDLYDGGRRANIPYPGHSRNDRSVSLLYDNGRVLATCFGDGTWQKALDDLREKGLIDYDHRPTSVVLSASSAGYQPPASKPERTAAARRLWEGGRPVGRTLAETHARLRRIRRDLPGDAVARFNRETPLSAYRDSSRLRTRPALLLAIHDEAGALNSVEVTYLNPNGTRASDLRVSRKTVGTMPPSSAVRVDAAAPEMLVAEGFFTTLSATERFSLPGWALMSTRNMRGWNPPEGVRSVLVAGDNGEDGRRSAGILAARLRGRGLQVRLDFPEPEHDDWNDAAAVLVLE